MCAATCNISAVDVRVLAAASVQSVAILILVVWSLVRHIL